MSFPNTNKISYLINITYLKIFMGAILINPFFINQYIITIWLSKGINDKVEKISLMKVFFCIIEILNVAVLFFRELLQSGHNRRTARNLQGLQT